MIANHPLMRTAIEKALIAGALALMAFCVAALAFELRNRWTLSGSLIVAGICNLVAVYNICIAWKHWGKSIR
jgi:hypothetical protein